MNYLGWIIKACTMHMINYTAYTHVLNTYLHNACMSEFSLVLLPNILAFKQIDLPRHSPFVYR